ncbi:MAG: fluoride efflux transporter CrcB [Rhodospirillales bacterium]
MKALVLVMIGGGLGAGLRYGVGLAASRAFGLSFPWGTMICNLTGSLLMGALVGAAAIGFLGDTKEAEQIRLLIGVGVLGGFTTFSSFSLEAISLWQRGETIQVAIYILLSVGLGLAGFIIGEKLARGFA